jgi:hypothetical protein
VTSAYDSNHGLYATQGFCSGETKLETSKEPNTAFAGGNAAADHGSAKGAVAVYLAGGKGGARGCAARPAWSGRAVLNFYELSRPEWLQWAMGAGLRGPAMGHVQR